MCRRKYEKLAMSTLLLEVVFFLLPLLEVRFRGEFHNSYCIIV